MYLETFHLISVRNLEDQAVELGPGFNYLYGSNGAGKTALLEGIYLLARGRSFRSQRIAPIIRYGDDKLIVRAEMAMPSGSHRQLAMSKGKDGVTELRSNGVKTQRASELARHLPVQTLLPNAADLVLGAPGLRRGFLDWGLFHVEPLFVEMSRNYRRVLAQRNAFLKDLGRTGTIPEIKEDPWFQQYQNLSSEISVVRQGYVDLLSPLFSEILAQLLPEINVSMLYDWGGLENVHEADKKMSESWSRDVKFGITHRGPHRADLLFAIAGRPAADSVSRGQAKLIASAVVLAQAKLLYEQTDTKSVFLIDDFGAELDAERWQYFLETLLQLECQVVATSTEPLNQSESWISQVEGLRVFHVEHGRINPIEAA